MEKEICALEIRNTTAILTIGNVLKDEKKVNIVYQVVRPLSTFLKNGEVLDQESLTRDIKKMLVYEDLKHNIRTKINEIILVYEPYGLDVFNSEKSGSVLSSDNLIGRNDIKNVVNSLKKERIPNRENAIIDIVPSFFLIDGAKKFTEVPLGQASTDLVVNANIYTLPERNFRDLLDAVQNAGVVISKVVISPVGTAQLFKSYNPNIDTYVLVDCGKKSTIVSFIGNNTVYSSTWFKYGFSDLVDEVAVEFNISRGEAEDLINLYGLDSRTSVINPVICTSEIDNLKATFYADDLNAIVSKYFKDFVEQLNAKIDSLINVYSDEEKALIKNNLSVMFIGDGLKINGFKDYLFKFLEKDYICTFPSLPNIGLLDSTYFNCAGAMLSSTIYTGSLEDDVKGTFTEVVRDVVKRESYKETKDEL